MAGRDRLRDDVRRTTLPRFPLPTATEGAGRLFDWADALSDDTYRTLGLPDADQAALASDFRAVGHDFDLVFWQAKNYFRLNSMISGQGFERYLRTVADTPNYRVKEVEHVDAEAAQTILPRWLLVRWRGKHARGDEQESRDP